MLILNKRFFVKLKHSFYFFSPNSKNNAKQALFYFTWTQSAKTSEGRCPTVLGLQCYGLTVACDNRQANANASSFKSLTLLPPSGKDSEEYFTRNNINNFICSFPTWRRTDRERLKFLVRHREWDNMMAVWQQPESGRETFSKAEEAHTTTTEVVWDKPTACRGGRIEHWGGEFPIGCVYFARMVFHKLGTFYNFK